MADIFLSYSVKDREAAEAVMQALTERGYDVFWDQDTPPGIDWDTWIRTKLTHAKAAIVLWSKNSIASPNVRHEAIVARDAGKLVPAMIETLKPADFPMGLYLTQAVVLNDWRNAEGRGMPRLIAEIEARLGARKPPLPGSVKPREVVRKINWVGVAVGIVLIAGTTGLTQAYYGGWFKQKAPAITGACSNGLPRLTDGSCPITLPTDVASPCVNGIPVAGGCATIGKPVDVQTKMFSERILGRWSWVNKTTCEKPQTITLSGDRLTITSDTGVPYVHTISSDAPEETVTMVISPKGSIGQRYTLTPEFFTSSDTRNFNLVVQQDGAERNVWEPCEQ